MLRSSSTMWNLDYARTATAPDRKKHRFPAPQEVKDQNSCLKPRHLIQSKASTTDGVYTAATSSNIDASTQSRKAATTGTARLLRSWGDRKDQNILVCLPERVRTKIRNGPIGEAAAKLAIGTNVANSPPVNKDAVFLLPPSDNKHSRQSYYAIVSDAVAHARDQVPKGEKPVYACTLMGEKYPMSQAYPHMVNTDEKHESHDAEIPEPAGKAFSITCQDDTKIGGLATVQCVTKGPQLESTRVRKILTPNILRQQSQLSLTNSSLVATPRSKYERENIQSSPTEQSHLLERKCTIAVELSNDNRLEIEEAISSRAQVAELAPICFDETSHVPAVANSEQDPRISEQASTTPTRDHEHLLQSTKCKHSQEPTAQSLFPNFAIQNRQTQDRSVMLPQVSKLSPYTSTETSVINGRSQVTTRVWGPTKHTLGTKVAPYADSNEVDEVRRFCRSPPPHPLRQNPPLTIFDESGNPLPYLSLHSSFVGRATLEGVKDQNGHNNCYERKESCLKGSALLDCVSVGTCLERQRITSTAECRTCHTSEERSKSKKQGGFDRNHPTVLRPGVTRELKADRSFATAPRPNTSDDELFLSGSGIPTTTTHRKPHTIDSIPTNKRHGIGSFPSELCKELAAATVPTRISDTATTQSRINRGQLQFKAATYDGVKRNFRDIEFERQRDEYLKHRSVRKHATPNEMGWKSKRFGEQDWSEGLRKKQHLHKQSQSSATE